MWAVWRSFELAASRRLQRVYLSAAQARAGGDYFSDYVPLDQVSQPLLPSSHSARADHDNDDDDDNNAYRHHRRQSSLSSTTTNPFPILILPSRTKRRLSFLGPWRSKIRHIAFIVVAVILLVGSPTILKFLHLYSDPGYDDKFLRPLYTPHPAPIEQLVPPVSLPKLTQRRQRRSSSQPLPNTSGSTPSTEQLLDHDDNDDSAAKRLEALLPALQNELAARLDSLGMPAYTNHTHCSSLSGTATQLRYGHLASSTRGRTLIGLNLYNSQTVLPSIGRALLSLAQFLGPKNVVISIFENGSDDGTREGLAHLAAVLTAAGIPHRIVSDEAKTQWENVDRISQLALYRNVVLEPLYHLNTTATTTTNGQAAEEKPFENVMFINDVYFCPTDALELLHVRATQQAHATCGLDWRWRHNSMPSLLGTGPKVRSCSSLLVSVSVSFTWQWLVPNTFAFLVSCVITTPLCVSITDMGRRAGDCVHMGHMCLFGRRYRFRLIRTFTIFFFVGWISMRWSGIAHSLAVWGIMPCRTHYRTLFFVRFLLFHFVRVCHLAPHSLSSPPFFFFLCA